MEYVNSLRTAAFQLRETNISRFIADMVRKKLLLRPDVNTDSEKHFDDSVIKKRTQTQIL